MSPSLCEICCQMREVRTTRSRFVLCELSLVNVNYPKYPPQPVVWCDAYKPHGPPTGAQRVDPES